ncbi:MAG: OsmC family protein [Deltaproteobacteria bacterium]|nr:OsmC family protein [Deltaproteobacteria bacterium]
MKKNNVDVDRVRATVKGFEKDPQAAKKVNKVEGEWNPGNGAQFSATLSFENGKVTLMADQPAFLGGGGTHPGPIAYCLYGSASCYAATFATMAAMEGVEIKKLTVSVETQMDFSRVFGLSENPIVESVKLSLYVESDAPKEKIKYIEALSKVRCPALYCLSNPIPLKTELKTG